MGNFRHCLKFRKAHPPLPPPTAKKMAVITLSVYLKEKKLNQKSKIITRSDPVQQFGYFLKIYFLVAKYFLFTFKNETTIFSSSSEKCKKKCANRNTNILFTLLETCASCDVFFFSNQICHYS